MRGATPAAHPPIVAGGAYRGLNSPITNAEQNSAIAAQ